MSKISWFSCGAASYCASKLALQDDPDIEIIYIDVGWEHLDNQRFLHDAEKILGPIKVLKNPRYNNPAEVFRAKRFIKTPFGAPCTLELKKSVRQKYETGLEVQYFGFDASEEKRRDRFLASNKEQAHLFRFPLIEHGWSKERCLEEIERDGIVVPITYRQGFKNANCIGCVKAGRGYWKKIRELYPERFSEMISLEKEIGYTLFKDSRTKEPIPLEDLDWDKVKQEEGLSWECGILCINEGE